MEGSQNILHPAQQQKKTLLQNRHPDISGSFGEFGTNSLMQKPPAPLQAPAAGCDHNAIHRSCKKNDQNNIKLLFASLCVYLLNSPEQSSIHGPWRKHKIKVLLKLSLTHTHTMTYLM